MHLFTFLIAYGLPLGQVHLGREIVQIRTTFIQEAEGTYFVSPEAQQAVDSGLLLSQVPNALQLQQGNPVHSPTAYAKAISLFDN